MELEACWKPKSRVMCSGFTRWLTIIKGSAAPAVGAPPPKKELQPLPMTPLEKMLMELGPIREDGSDKFFGMENVSLRRNLPVR
jgi:hypothetical protein